MSKVNENKNPVELSYETFIEINDIQIEKYITEKELRKDEGHIESRILNRLYKDCLLNPQLGKHKRFICTIEEFNKFFKQVDNKLEKVLHV